MGMTVENEKRDAREDLVHPKFIERWARIYLEYERDHGRKAAISWASRALHPDDARAVGQEARRLKQLYPNLRPKPSS